MHAQTCSTGAISRDGHRPQSFRGKEQREPDRRHSGTEPAPLSEIQAAIPPALEHVVSTCLAKAPESRWQTALDVSIELKWIAQGGSAAAPSQAPGWRMPLRAHLAWLAGALLLAALTAWTVMGLRPSPQFHSTRFEFTVPGPPDFLTFPVVSPDGQYVAARAAGDHGKVTIWLRPLNSLSARPLPRRRMPSGPSGQRTARKSHSVRPRV